MITVHHLNNSRSQRILWLLEELGVGYDVKFYQRDAQTSLAPDALKAVHPLGKSPVIEDDDIKIAESGAIVDYLIRRHGNGALRPAPDTRLFEDYLEWLHFAEGSAMLPLMLGLYVGRLGGAGAPLKPRIDEQTASILDFFDAGLGDADWLVGNTLSGADIMMSFVGEVAATRGPAERYPRLVSYVRRIQARPAWAAAVARGGPYALMLPASATVAPAAATAG